MSITADRLYRSKYGISEADVKKMFAAQNGLCPICGVQMTLEGQYAPNRACVDHCYKKNRPRGLLCRLCNFAIGHFKDNIDFLVNAVVYLRSWNDKLEPLSVRVPTGRTGLLSRPQKNKRAMEARCRGY